MEKTVNPRLRKSVQAADHDFSNDYLTPNNVDTLIINANNSSRRTQFMKRIMEFAAKYGVKILLAYSPPPYHSKYNPIERIWGRLEQHWNGSTLNTQETVLNFTKSMNWKSKTPCVSLAEKPYETGEKVEKVMESYEEMIDWVKGIEKWFVEINPNKCRGVLQME